MDFEQVRNIIAESLGCDVEQVTLEAALVDDLGSRLSGLCGAGHGSWRRPPAFPSTTTPWPR